MKVHKYKYHGDFSSLGQTDFERSNSTACGYVRDHVTRKDKEVTCKLCLREMEKNR
jgi:hypothetical protein